MPKLTRWLLAIAYAGLCIVYTGWVWIDQITEYGGDSSAYMLWARYLSGSGEDLTVLHAAVRETPFPPLYPLTVALFGGSFLAAHLVVAASLLVSTALLYIWLEDEGLQTSIRAAAVLTFSLMPGTYLLALNIMSENLYLALSLAAIVLERRAGKARAGQISLWWWLTVVLALTPLARTAGVTLLAAFALRSCIVRPRHWPWRVITSWLPFLAWAAWSAVNGAGLSVYAKQGLPWYSQHPLDQLLLQLKSEGAALLAAWTDDYLIDLRSPALVITSSVLALICLLGFFARLRRASFDAIYVALYLIVLSVWPFADAAQRLSYVIVPILLAQGALLIFAVGRRLPKRQASLLGGLCAASLILVLLPSLLWTARRFSQPLPADREVERHTLYWYRITDSFSGPLAARFLSSILQDLPYSARQIPPGECIFSTKATVVTLLTNRMSYQPPAFHASATQFEKDLARCHYAYALATISPTYPEALYPLGRLQNRYQVLSEATSAGAYPIPFAELVKLTP